MDDSETWENAKSVPAKVDRQPPHSLEAEQGVIGCCLLAPNECLNDCIITFKAGGEELYGLRERTIYQVMVEMWDKKLPMDLITIQQKLKDKNLLEGVGGLSYLASLPDAVPSAANLMYYAGIVIEKYGFRKVVQGCTQIVGAAYSHIGEAQAFFDSVDHDFRKLMADIQPASSPIKSASDLIPDVVIRLEKLYAAEGKPIGISSGFSELDSMTGGFMDGELTILAGRPGTGKAQPVWANVLTPFGFKPIGDIQVGDYVIGLTGKPTKVLGIYPQGILPIFKVSMSDGSSTHSTGDHLWVTKTRNERRFNRGYTVKTLSKISETIHRPDGVARNHALPNTSPVQYAALDSMFPIHPWLLGALIGDGKLGNGNIEFCKPEQDLIEKVMQFLPHEDIGVLSEHGDQIRIKRKQRSNLSSATKIAIRSLGLAVHSHLKFIPDKYLMASVENRMELLRGLIDTDGSVSGVSTEFSTSSQQLAKDFVTLVRSLGLQCVIHERQTKFSYLGQKKNGRPSWRIHMQSCGTIFSSEKHQSRLAKTTRRFHRSIVSVTPSGEQECRCIRVDAADGIYITDDFIPTHNTSLSLNIADHIAVDKKIPVGYFSLEMDAVSLGARMVSARAEVDLKAAKLWKDSDWSKIYKASVKINSAPFRIMDERGISILKLRANAKRMFDQFGIRILFVDYLQLMSAMVGKSDNREREIAAITSGLRTLAGELKIPVVALAQLNRESERENRRPRMTDLREGGSCENDADLIGILYKPKSGNDDDPLSAANMAPQIPVSLSIVKNRNGPCGEVALTFHRMITLFKESKSPTHEYTTGNKT